MSSTVLMSEFVMHCNEAFCKCFTGLVGACCFARGLYGMAASIVGGHADDGEEAMVFNLKVGGDGLAHSPLPP